MTMYLLRMFGLEHIANYYHGCYSRIKTVALRRILWIFTSIIIGFSIATHHVHALTADMEPMGHDMEPMVHVYSLATQTDGRILVGGRYSREGSADRTSSFIVRLNDDGTLDLNFDLEPIDPKILAIQSNGKIIVVLEQIISAPYTLTPQKIIRLNSDGSIDKNFNSYSDDVGISTIAIQPDGKILIGRNAIATKSPPSTQTQLDNAIYRLNVDGSIDETFNQIILDGRWSYIKNIIVQPDSKILIGGRFNNIDGQPRVNIARLNSDGSLDNEFETNVNNFLTLQNFPVVRAIQPDGKMLIHGLCDYHDSQINYPVIRLNTDGTCDRSFNPDSRDPAWAISLQPDGKIMASGRFYLGRLDSYGIKDLTFKTHNVSVHKIIVDEEGKVIVGGSFQTLDLDSKEDRDLHGLVRLNADGSVDETFKPWTDNLIESMVPSNSNN